MIEITDICLCTTLTINYSCCLKYPAYNTQTRKNVPKQKWKDIIFHDPLQQIATAEFIYYHP